MKKVLIVTYYWPPAGGAGVQRALKFAKYLPDFGWEPIILTVENPDSPVIDFSLLADIPKDCKVYKTKSLEPFNLYKKLIGNSADENIPGDVLLNDDELSLKNKISKWVRLNLFIPDAKIGWKNYAVKKGLEIIKNESIDLIFTTSPPQTTALIGRKLAKISGVKWIADFRDPWLEIVYYQKVKRNFITKAIDSSLEKKVMKQTDTIITISKDLAILLRSKSKNKNVVVIPNGFDETDFEPSERESNNVFTISYTGAMSKDRVPYVFIKALKRIISVDGIKNIRINFAGKFCSELYQQIKKENLSEYFLIQNYIPHNESTKLLQNSDALLLVIDNVPNNKGFLTGKIFEYLGCRKPIFAIGPLKGDANLILTESDSGTMIDYNDTEGAYQALLKIYKEWKNRKINYTFRVEPFSRRRLTENLKQLFEEVIS